MKKTSTRQRIFPAMRTSFIVGWLCIISTGAFAQLGVYSFTGFGACPNQNPAVTAQPANAVFSNFTSVNATCHSVTNAYQTNNWNTLTTLDSTEYSQFTVTANAGYALNLTSFGFTQYTDQNDASTAWTLRSSIDNFTTNIATGTSNLFSQTASIDISTGNFTNIAGVTFRLYLTKAKTGATNWTVDEITLGGSVIPVPATPANPISNSPQCAVNGVTLQYNGTPPAGETWYWETSANGTGIANSTSSYTVNTSGTYFLRAQNNTTLNWSIGAGFATVNVISAVGTPVFIYGAGSVRCQTAGTVIYSANAANKSGVSYSLDAASTAAGNTIDPATGTVTYTASWTGASVITATATGCGFQTTAAHTATTIAFADPVIIASPDTICSGAFSQITLPSTQAALKYTLRDNSNNSIIVGPVNGTGAAYSFNTGTLASNKIYNILQELPSSRGVLNFDGVNDAVNIPDAPALNPANFTAECRVKLNAYQPWSVLLAKTDPARSTGWALTMNSTGNKFAFFVNGYPNGIVFSATTVALNTWYQVAATYDGAQAKLYVNGVLEATTSYAGNTIYTPNNLTIGSLFGTAYELNGALDEARIWNTARTASQVQNNMNSILTGTEANLTAYYPFEDGAGSSAVTDLAGNNNGSLNNMDPAAAWGTVSFIQCSMQNSSNPTVTIRANLANPSFTLGNTSTRCISAGTVNYSATAANNTGLVYSLDAASLTAGNTIDPNTGDVTYQATWGGPSVITVTANGCPSSKTKTHTVTITGTVAAPVFQLGAGSNRCMQAQQTTYQCTAVNSTSISYSLDATSAAAGNTVSAVGSGAKITFTATWTGTTILTATALGCNGPSASVIHTITTAAPVTAPVFTLGTTSTRCQGAGTVSYDATAANNTGITYSLDNASLSGGNSINSATGIVTYAASWSGTTTVTASAAGCFGPQTATHTVTVTPTVGLPIFTSGSTSTRCQGANTVTYTANSTNNTGIVYSLDATSAAAGNTINPATGAVTYTAGWIGNAMITATASGCNGPRSATHTATSNITVSAPVFAAGSSSTRCQGLTFVTYNATALNSTSIVYSLDAASLAGGNTINSSTGIVVYNVNWSGTSTITASAAGCNGPAVSTHTVTITPTVGVPAFAAGSSSNRCQAAQTIIYNASSTNSTGISYSLDAISLAGGVTIDPSSGTVVYPAAWNGTTKITASATGCNGPSSAVHTVSITPTVGTPVFAMGLQSVREQSAQTITYSATATNNTGIVYSLDASSLAAGNTINSATGVVGWSANWFGASSISATATGCNGPSTASHIVNINSTIAQTPLYLSDPGQALDRIDPVAANIIPTKSSFPISSAAGGVVQDAISTVSGVTTNITLSHTTGSGTNRLMLVGISQQNRLVTSVTYGAVPLTLVGENNTNGNARVSLYQMLNPPSGTANVSVTFNSPPDKGAVISVTTYTGVNQTTPLGTFATAQAKTTNPTVTVASAAGELLYDVVSVRNASMTAGAGQTQKWNIFSGVENYGGGSTKPGTASTTMTWTAANTDWCIGAVSIKPSVNIPSISFTQIPALCNNLVIKAQTVQVVAYVNLTLGSMPVNPAITAAINYDSTNIITLTNPVYNSASKILSWTGTLNTDVSVPSGKSISLVFTSAQPGVEFQVLYHSKTYPSRISMLPVATFVDFASFHVYNAPYPNGNIRISGNTNTNYYARAVVTTPFGYHDITGMDLMINPPGSMVAVTCVDSSACTRTYEFPWTTSASTGTYYLLGTAKEGYENLVKNSELVSFDVCTVCPPVALDDSASGAGGAPLLVDVLANDYDPNNNIKVSTLAVTAQPDNGSAYISNNKIVYLPNGIYSGRDTLSYSICDSTGLCAQAKMFVTINPTIIDPCSEATESSVYYLPFSENEARMSLDSSSSIGVPSNNIRTIISLKMPYPGMTIIWDEWEDGYESNPLNPTQTTTKVWGDGNPYNGVAPGYPDDIIPAGGSIILDNIIQTNPRVSTNIFYDGRDKIIASGRIAVTQVSGEPSIIGLQCMKTNVSPVSNYGTSFTVPAGQNYNSQDFSYTSLFIRGSKNNTTVQIDKDNNGTLETTAVINEGEVLFVNGSVMSGATITSSADVGVDVHYGGRDSYSSRDVPIFPASWYSNTYYSPVPTTGRAANPADSAVVLLYNSLSRPITVNWSSGVPASGTLNIPAKTVMRFPLVMSQTAAYKFVNPTGEAFTAIEIVDSYTPGGGGNSGSEFDWSFNLISHDRLTDFATVAWAPGSTDGTRDDNPVWVTPTNNTTIYVKYDGNIGGNTGLVSPCGFRYDVSYPLNALTHKRLLDLSDNDQSGLAVYTCDGTKIAAVYGEDPSTATPANPSWDVGSTLQPFCKQKLIFANDDYARTMVSQSVTIPVLVNDFGFLAVVDPTSVATTGLLQPKNGTVSINVNGTLIYTPNTGYVGKDTFEYRVCSTPSPIICDNALVYVDISSCPAPLNENVIAGKVFSDTNGDGLNNETGAGVAGAKVYLYSDANCNQAIDAHELKDSVTVDSSGTYQFITYPEKYVADDFDNGAGGRSCANGSDGNATWLSDWVDAGDQSIGFCNITKTESQTDCDIYKDGSFGYALRMKDKNISATRTVNLTGATYAFLSFSYRRKSATMTAGRNLIVQASSNGSTFGTIFTIAGTGAVDADYVTILNQDISAYAGPTTYIRFLTNNSMQDADTVYIDNVKVQFLRYPQCYITRLDPSSIPAYYHTTNATQSAFTANNASTCLSPYDFGVAKNTINISGTLFHDANGLTDNLINGTGMGSVSTIPVFAYLADSANKVLRKTTVTEGTGNYLFSNADVYTNYSLLLSTVNVNIGDQAPPDAGISSIAGNWVPTGDAFGTNNAAGLGTRSSSPQCAIAVSTTNLSVASVDFGMEKLPDSDDRLIDYSYNTPNVQYDIAGGLTGSDAEDGALAAGKTYKITSLPYAAVLFYNGSAVALNQVITSFNPALLKIDPDDDITITSFQFASMDAAGLFDPTPATITVRWLTVLPVTLINFDGVLNGSKVDLTWNTSSEVNTNHFDVQKSTDGANFSRLGIVTAHGTQGTETHYALTDPSPSPGINYYRLKTFDSDGSFVYSNIVPIRISSTKDFVSQVRPNPFTTKVEVTLELDHSTPIQFALFDNNGRLVYTQKENGVKGKTTFTLFDLEALPSATYILKIITDTKSSSQKLMKL